MHANVANFQINFFFGGFFDLYGFLESVFELNLKSLDSINRNTFNIWRIKPNYCCCLVMLAFLVEFIVCIIIYLHNRIYLKRFVNVHKKDNSSQAFEINSLSGSYEVSVCVGRINTNKLSSCKCNINNMNNKIKSDR